MRNLIEMMIKPDHDIVHDNENDNEMNSDDENENENEHNT